MREIFQDKYLNYWRTEHPESLCGQSMQSTQLGEWTGSYQVTEMWPLKHWSRQKVLQAPRKKIRLHYEGARLRIALNFSASTLQGTRKESNSFILPRKMIFFLTHCPIYDQILHSMWGILHNLNVQSNGGSTEVLHSEREIHGFNKWGFPV